MDGEPIPATESLETHQASDDYKGGIWALVNVDISNAVEQDEADQHHGARPRSGDPGRSCGARRGNTVWSARSRSAQLRRTSVHGVISTPNALGAVESAATMGTRCKASAFPQRLGSLRLPHFPQPRGRSYLATINLEVGPFYSIEVGSFYVVKARGGVF